MKNRVVITTNQILWTIILLNTSDDWYIDYINDKLNYQIKLNNLEENINILLLDKIEDIQDFENLGEYLNIINNGDISDNYIKTIYNNLEKTKKNCLCFSGIYKSKDVDYVFNQKEENSEEIFIPINKMNPIKREFVLKKFNNYIEGEFKKISAKFIDDILVYIDSDIDLNKTINQETKESFSIILTAYKTEKFIEECLDSIESQTYFENNDNYEILVGVDGCENTLNKLNEIKDKYRNLYIYMMKENRGTYMTTNALLNLIKYENVIRFDTDDIMEPNLVEDLVDFKNINDDDVIKLGYSDWREGKKINDYVLVNDGIIYFKKSVMDDIAGGYMPWECAADSELISRLKGRVKISGLNKRLFIRRIHDNSLTKKNDTGYGSLLRRNYNAQIKSVYRDDEVKIERVSNELQIISTDYIPLECIVTRPDNYNPFESVKKMILSNFRTPEHSNTLVLLGYNVGKDISEYRAKYTGRKIVIYQLEQLYNNCSQWYNLNSTSAAVIERTINIKKMLSDCDEIWDYDLDNIDFLIKEGFTNIKHVPLTYSSALIMPMNYDKSIDVLFYGSINETRAEYLEELSKHFSMMIIAPTYDCQHYVNKNFGKYMKPAVFNDELYEFISRSKIVINIHYYESHLQEQVRLFELLINNITVVSQKSLRNYYGDLIVEVENKHEMVKEIKKILENNSWKNNKISQRFKQIKYTQLKIGAAYNTFYGFDLIEKSLDSIREKVDYIVLVHQKTGLNGQTELLGTKEKIQYLLNTKKIDDIVYVDFPRNINLDQLENFILNKRNIGLEKCIENSCNIIIPMDADECYEMKFFYPEIINMYVNGFDTLYSPIHSYYYDDKHWFLDTYYVPSAIRIYKNKKFEKCKSSVLVDPVRKMKEGVYRISNIPMHHYTYLKDSFINKIERNVASTNSEISQNMKRILECLKNWKEGDKALVFTNDLSNGGKVVTSYVDLKKKNI